MKKYIYACPRCGRQWVRFIPRSKMKCPFCSEVWHTRGRRSSRSRFSWTATFLWLFWIALIVSVALWHRQMYEFGMNFIASHPIIKPERKSNAESEEPPVVPPIDFFEKQKQKLEEERERLEAEKAKKEARKTVDGETDSEGTTDEVSDIQLDDLPVE